MSTTIVTLLFPSAKSLSTGIAFITCGMSQFKLVKVIWDLSKVKIAGSEEVMSKTTLEVLFGSASRTIENVFVRVFSLISSIGATEETVQFKSITLKIIIVSGLSS